MEREEISEKLAGLGPLQSAEIKTLVVFAMTISLWLVTPLLNRLSGGAVNLPLQAVALFGGICLFLPKMNVLSWKQAQHDVDWGGIVLIAAGISLGLTVFETGAAHWLALVLMGEMGVVPVLLRPFLIVLAVAMLHMFVFQQYGDGHDHHTDTHCAGGESRAGPLGACRPGPPLPRLWLSSWSRRPPRT